MSKTILAPNRLFLAEVRCYLDLPGSKNGFLEKVDWTSGHA